jgi:8-oxo-dGTP pyrophosphatase MutT (NUDIX family)
VRALVVDAQERVLLLRFENPVTRAVWWATPGGGVEGEESDEQTLRRELREECGLDYEDAGPVVWQREHVYPWDGELHRQRERFHLIRVERLEVAPTIDLEAEHVHGHRWWTVEELEATGERLAPRALATDLRALLRDGPPREPLEVSR